jgi:hypothetical protein
MFLSIVSKTYSLMSHENGIENITRKWNENISSKGASMGMELDLLREMSEQGYSPMCICKSCILIKKKSDMIFSFYTQSIPTPITPKASPPPIVPEPISLEEPPLPPQPQTHSKAFRM